MMDGNDINLEYEGKIVTDFEDLVDFEKYQRAVEVNSLLADVDNFENVVEENEEYFRDEYDSLDDDIGDLYDSL